MTSEKREDDLTIAIGAIELLREECDVSPVVDELATSAVVRLRAMAADNDRDAPTD
jgi:hypothetical protein